MYPKILFFVLGLFFPLWASAQELYRSLNIQTGVNLSKIRYYDRLTSSDFVVLFAAYWSEKKRFDRELKAWQEEICRIRGSKPAAK